MLDKFGVRKFARLTSDFSPNRFSLNLIVNFMQTSDRNFRLRFFRRNRFNQNFYKTILLISPNLSLCLPIQGG